MIANIGLPAASAPGAGVGNGATVTGTNTIKFGATAQASIGVSADTTAGNLVFTPSATGIFVLNGTTRVGGNLSTTPTMYSGSDKVLFSNQYGNGVVAGPQGGGWILDWSGGSLAPYADLGGAVGATARRVTAVYTGITGLNFGATANATIGVSADSAAGHLVFGFGGGVERLGIGGSTASFPGIRRTGTGLDFVTADASSWVTIQANALQLQGSGNTLTIPSTSTIKFGASGNATIGLSVDSTSGNLTLTAPSSGLNAFVGGLKAGSYNEQTGATYTVLSTDFFINANRAGTITLTLGTATTGRILKVRTITANTVVSASSNVVPAAGGAAGTAILAATAGKWATLMGDGTNWQIIESN